MALNIGASGVIRPYVKYNAKSDKWFVRGEGGGDLEIARPTFLLDLANIRTGWLHFAPSSNCASAGSMRQARKDNPPSATPGASTNSTGSLPAARPSKTRRTRSPFCNARSA